MNKFLTISASTTLLLGVFLITGCSSSDDGGTTTTSDDGGTTTTASVPANAIVIDAANAEETVASAIDDFDVVDSVFAVEIKPAVNIKDTLDIIKTRINNISNNSGVDLATGTTISESGDCTDGGTFSISGSETSTGTTESGDITAIFINCNELGVILNGTISISFTDNLSTGDFTADFSGSLSILISGESITLSIRNLQFSESGNDFNGTYTITKLTYSIDFITDGIGSDGFLVTLTAPIVESNGDLCPESGHVTITGANGTTAEGIYNGDGTMTIKANGEIVTTTAPCYG